MKRYTRFIPLISISLLFLTGCGKERPKTKVAPTKTVVKTMRINITTEPQSIDPRKVRSLNDINLLKMFMEGLARVNQEGQAELALAKKVDVSKDLKTYTFHLKDAHWSNGDPITSKDFIYAWKKSLSPEFPSNNAFQLYVIKNARPIKEGKLPMSLLGISAPDEQTLVIELEHPTPYFIKLTTHPVFFPVNTQVDKSNEHWAENSDTFIGNGPFNLNSWRHHNVIEATKNSLYWDKKNVKLASLEVIMVDQDTGFKMFEANQLDWEGSPFSMIPSDAYEAIKDQIQSKPILGTKFIRINTEHEILKSLKFRQALCYALNRDEIVTHVVAGNQRVATGLVPDQMNLQEQPHFQDGNIEKAKELLDQYLAENSMRHQDLPKLTLVFSANDRNHVMAQAIQEQWRQVLGFRVNLLALENKVYFDYISKKNFDLGLGSWTADFDDPVNFLEVFKTKDNGTNNTNWENREYIKLLEASRRCSDEKDRLKILAESEKVLIQELPMIPIFHYTMLYVKDPKVHNVVLTPTGEIDFKWADIK